METNTYDRDSGWRHVCFEWMWMETYLLLCLNCEHRKTKVKNADGDIVSSTPWVFVLQAKDLRAKTVGKAFFKSAPSKNCGKVIMPPYRSRTRSSH